MSPGRAPTPRERLLGRREAAATRPSGRPVVLLDTNALFLPLTRRFPLEREIARLMEGARIQVPSSVLGELDRLAARGNARAKAARAFADRFPVASTDLLGDAALEVLAKTLDAWVVTGDRELRARLEGAGLKVLFPRGEKLARAPRAPPLP